MKNEELPSLRGRPLALGPTPWTSPKPAPPMRVAGRWPPSPRLERSLALNRPLRLWEAAINNTRVLI